MKTSGQHPDPAQQNQSPEQQGVLSLAERTKTRKPGVAKRRSDARAQYPGLDLDAVEAAVRDLPDMDVARVVDLHNRILAETYAPQAGRIAAALLNFERALDRES